MGTMMCPSPLKLLFTLIIIASVISSNRMSCKTTLSKLQYINAIRDIIEGLIKSLATRQKIEQTKRLELYEYRKLHQRRLGKDVLICRLCKEIFVDPEKYFDHAHFHIVEKLELSLTTNVNIPCKLCEDTFNNKYDYYKHCYEAHLEQNMDKLTTRTTPATTITTKVNHAEDLYCKVCNITILYPEKFYVHSYQHLKENMDIIMNQTHTRIPNSTTKKQLKKRTNEFISRERTTTYKSERADIVENKEEGNYLERQSTKTKYKKNKNSVTLWTTSSVLDRKMSKKTVSEDTTNIFRSLSTSVSQHTTKPQFEFDSETKKRATKIKEYASRKINNKNDSRNLTLNATVCRQINFTFVNKKQRSHTEFTKSSLSKINITQEPCTKLFGGSTSEKVTITSRYSPEIVDHIKRVAQWAVNKERKKDPNANIGFILRYDKKKHMQEVLRQQQSKLHSLEKVLDNNENRKVHEAELWKFVANATQKILVNTKFRTLPLCFITEPRRRMYDRKQNYSSNALHKKYTINKTYYGNSTFQRRNYTSTYYINKKLYKNFKYSDHNYQNIMQVYLSNINGTQVSNLTCKTIETIRRNCKIGLSSSLKQIIRNNTSEVAQSLPLETRSNDITSGVLSYRIKRHVNLEKPQVVQNSAHNLTATQSVLDELSSKVTPSNKNGNTWQSYNLYTTPSRIIERIFQTQVRIVRITKDLRTTKKITLKPYTGAQEFTGDSFQGESGENRYSQALEKLRVTGKMYLKCPYCPLRYYAYAELLGHVSSHNMSHYEAPKENDTLPFKTLPPHLQKYKEEHLDGFEEFFPTFDIVTYATESTTPGSTTLNMDQVSDILGKIMNPEYLKGFHTTPRSTRNIDFLHRDRTVGTTGVDLSKVGGMLENVRNYLRQLVTTAMMADATEDYYDYLTTAKTITTTTKETYGMKTSSEIFNEEGGVRIDEITMSTKQNSREYLQKQVNVAGDLLNNIKDIADAENINKGIQVPAEGNKTYYFRTSDQSTTRTPLYKVTNNGQNVELQETSDPDELNSKFSFEDSAEKFVVLGKQFYDALNKTTKVKPQSTTRYENKACASITKLRWKKRTTEEYKLLHGTELNVKEDDRIRSILELLRRTRPVENYYRYIFDYKRRLGPTEMSYEDNNDDTTMKIEPVTAITDGMQYRANYRQFMESLLKEKAQEALRTTTTSHYENFIKSLAKLREEEKRRKEKQAADYEEKIKAEEKGIDEDNTPLMMNVDDMRGYQGECKERNEQVAKAFEFIVKNDIREAMWNSTKKGDATTLDDGYEDIDYDTITQYVYDETNHQVFENDPPTKVSNFYTLTPWRNATTIMMPVF